MKTFHLLLGLLSVALWAPASPAPVPFGSGGQVKMLFDVRQRPQSVYLNGKVYLVFNGGAVAGASAKTKPMAVTYDSKTRQFSDVVTLGSESRDHHHGPIIWADTEDRLHVLFGCHSTPGIHLVSRQPGSIGHSRDDWDSAAKIAPEPSYPAVIRDDERTRNFSQRKGLSYPAVFRVSGGRQLIYYRTGSHSSSWAYRLSSDNGRTWAGPANDVTDEDLGGTLSGRDEWASYQSKLPSRDGRFLHVAFIAYDDNKANDPKRFYNARYRMVVKGEEKYNLYLVKIDLQTHEVTNFDGVPMKTPIDIDQADEKCRIWDTEGRRAGVPPAIALDRNGDPAFLHVLSEDTITDHRYYYVRRNGGKWLQTPITHSNHPWNSGLLTRDDSGLLHAYLVVGDGYFDRDGNMDRYGGGYIEEWVSSDDGNSWSRKRDLTPDRSKYPGFKYNNIQAVTRPDGSRVDGMLIFYGWKDGDAPDAVAFLLHEDASPAPRRNAS